MQGDPGAHEPQVMGSRKDVMTGMSRASNNRPRATRLVALAALLSLTGGAAAAEVVGRLSLTSGSEPGSIRATTLYGAYLSGSFALTQNDLGAAAGFMTLALAQDPGNRDLIRTTFRLKVRSGQATDAVPLARRLIETDPNEQLAHILLALDDVRTGQFDSARQRLQRVQRRDVAGFAMPLVEAWVLAGLGDTPAAMAALDSLANTPGAQALVDMNRGLILDLAGDTDAAIAALQTAYERGQPLRLLQALGSLYERSDRRADAATLYARYEQDHPETILLGRIRARFEAGSPAPPLVDSPRDGIAEALFQVASALSQEAANDYALVYSRLSLFLRPDSPFGQILLGDVLSDLGQYETALAVYAAVDSAAPEAWLARLQSSRQLQRLEREGEALALLTAMAEERADRGDILVEIADIHRAARRFDLAIQAYDQAQARSPAMTDGDWSFFYRRGIALERNRQWARAESDLRRAISLNPDYAHLLNYLGYSWVDRGQNMVEAEQMIGRAVELAPNDGFIVDSLGWVYFRTGRLQEAVSTLQRAVELQPEDATINDHLGDAYWMVGRRAEARHQWQRALRTVEEDDLRRQIEEKLRNGLVDSGVLTNVAPQAPITQPPMTQPPMTQPL